MAGSLTTRVHRQLLEHYFGRCSKPPPSVLYFGLSRLGRESGGEPLEPPAADYERVEVPNLPCYFETVEGVRTNAFDFVFPVPRTQWGEIAEVFIADEKRGGRILGWMSLDEPRKVKLGHSPIVRAGQCRISFS